MHNSYIKKHVCQGFYWIIKQKASTKHCFQKQRENQRSKWKKTLGTLVKLQAREVGFHICSTNISIPQSFLGKVYLEPESSEKCEWRHKQRWLDSNQTAHVAPALPRTLCSLPGRCCSIFNSWPCVVAKQMPWRGSWKSQYYKYD